MRHDDDGIVDRKEIPGGYPKDVPDQPAADILDIRGSGPMYYPLSAQKWQRRNPQPFLLLSCIDRAG